MLARSILPVLCLALAGCGTASIAGSEDANVASSLQFDGVACKQLVAERNALAARYGLPQDAKPVFSSAPTGFGTVLPDTRSAHKRDADRASGRIDAMNRSLIRRKCVQEPKAG
jgi:hypothetical protein